MKWVRTANAQNIRCASKVHRGNVRGIYIVLTSCCDVQDVWQSLNLSPEKKT